MICKNCGKRITRDTLTCKNCGSSIYNNSYLDNKTSNVVKATILEESRKPFFSIATVCFSLYILVLLVVAIFGELEGILTSLIPFICAGISLYGLWEIIFAKESSNVNGKIQRIAIYDAYCRIACSILMIVILIVSFDGFKMISATTEGFVKTLSIIFYIIILLIFELIIWAIRLVYRNRYRYLIVLAHSSSTGMYYIKKVPVIGSYIISSFLLVAALLVLIDIPVIEPLIIKISDELKLGDALIKDMESIIFSCITGVISMISIGIYMLFSALWMRKLHHSLSFK